MQHDVQELCRVVRLSIIDPYIFHGPQVLSFLLRSEHFALDLMDGLLDIRMLK